MSPKRNAFDDIADAATDRGAAPVPTTRTTRRLPVDLPTADWAALQIWMASQDGPRGRKVGSGRVGIALFQLLLEDSQVQAEVMRRIHSSAE